MEVLKLVDLEYVALITVLHSHEMAPGKDPLIINVLRDEEDGKPLLKDLFTILIVPHPHLDFKPKTLAMIVQSVSLWTLKGFVLREFNNRVFKRTPVAQSQSDHTLACVGYENCGLRYYKRLSIVHFSSNYWMSIEVVSTEAIVSMVRT
jgi:hypothetical protein